MIFLLERLAVSYAVVFTIFYAVLFLYERFVKKIDITNKERFGYVAVASLVPPVTILGAFIFVVVKIFNSLKKW